VISSGDGGIEARLYSLNIMSKTLQRNATQKFKK